MSAPPGTAQERTGGFGFYFFLSHSFFYRLSQKAVWSAFGHRFFNEFAAARPGEKVLDIGCGPGDRLETLPDVDYTGFDLNSEYIAAAKQNHGTRARFFCGDVACMNFETEKGTFDLVLAHGMLHHVDDERVKQLFALAHSMLKEGGRLVTVDPCYTPGQSRASRWVVSHDRGRFVRETARYLELAGSAFTKVDSVVRHDLLRVPYTQILLRCIKTQE